MSQDNSVHPLDQEDDDEGSQGKNASSSLTGNHLSGVSILAILAGLFLMVTLAGAATMINASPNTQSEQFGNWLWQSGGIGMLICCFGILLLLRGKPLLGLIKKVVLNSSLMGSSFYSILIWSLGVFFGSLVLLTLLHLVFGSFRVFYYQFYLYSLSIPIVLALIGSMVREYRAFWIGFATSVFLSTYGLSFNPIAAVMNMPSAASVSMFTNPNNSNYGPGMGPGINPPNPRRFPGAPAYGNQTTAYRFEYRALLTQWSTLGWALFNGVLCSGIVAVSTGMAPATGGASRDNKPKA